MYRNDSGSVKNDPDPCGFDPDEKNIEVNARKMSGQETVLDNIRTNGLEIWKSKNEEKTMQLKNGVR